MPGIGAVDRGPEKRLRRRDQQMWLDDWSSAIDRDVVEFQSAVPDTRDHACGFGRTRERDVDVGAATARISESDRRVGSGTPDDRYAEQETTDRMTKIPPIPDASDIEAVARWLLAYSDDLKDVRARFPST